MQKIKNEHDFFFVYSLFLKTKLPNFENILKKCLLKGFLKNVNSIRIYPKLCHLGFQIDVMLAP
jgi:hypothetical protein